MTEREIFLALLDLPDAAARTNYLDRVCGDDPAGRARLESLLLSHDTAGSFLDNAAGDPSEPDELVTHTFRDGETPEEVNDDEALEFLAPTRRPNSLGRIGRYEVLEVLGRGGFGIVFRAFDETLQRVVAVKVLAPQMATNSPARKRFLREARSSAAVRHENVVQVYEVGEQPLPYLVMEYIPGETLQQKLDRTGPLEVPEVLQIGRQIAEGLASAHANDLIHRDIKPGNVLLERGPQQSAKITDFGLARAADDASISHSGVIAGTPLFMAPEQALGNKLDQRADLFSFGSVLYQMVSGRPPFRASSTLAVLKRVAEDMPRSIQEIIPETPAWLCEIIAKLHAKNPDERFQSAREIADVLADCEAQLKTHAQLQDFSRIPRGKPQRSVRRKWPAAVVAVLLPVLTLVLTETAGVTHLFRGPQPTPNDPELPPPTQVANKEMPQGDVPIQGAKKEKTPDPAPIDLIPEARPDRTLGKLPSDAVLVMNFEKETFYQKNGKTYVRDLSGHGNDGLCENVAFIADGKAGGGLLCRHVPAIAADKGDNVPVPANGKSYAGGLRIGNSLITSRPSYTITAWCRRVNAAGPLHVYLACRPVDPASPLFVMANYRERRFSVEAFCYQKSLRREEEWLRAVTDIEAVPEQEWFFVAVSFSDGARDGGNLRVFINDRRYDFISQTVNPHPDGSVDLVGCNTSGAVIDELAVFQRALSDQEIGAIRTLGLNGTAFGPANVLLGTTPPDTNKPPLAVAPSDAAQAKKHQEAFASWAKALTGLTAIPRKTAVVGTVGGVEFEDVPKDPALLVGLTGTLWKIGTATTIGSVQPIYLGAEGTKDGPVFGKGDRTMWRVVAKEGYAVGGIVLKPGKVIDGFKVVFMRIDGAPLNPKDSYESAWQGGRGGGTETMLGGDGRPVIGIHGGVGDALNRLGLVQLDLEEKK